MGPSDSKAKVTPPSPPFLTADEAAALLRITRFGIYKMVDRGQIPFIRRGKKALLFSQPDLLAHLAKCASSPLTPR